jgi:hypothetical protein
MKRNEETDIQSNRDGECNATQTSFRFADFGQRDDPSSRDQANISWLFE